VLERFVRLDTSRTTPGSGLGLSLVAAIARQHGATLELSDTRPGEEQPGLTARLRFPREPDERLALPSAA
jgi:signal transduction histidine kinase